MRQHQSWLRRIAGLLGRARRERELAAELDAHLQAHLDDRIRAGLTPIAARRDALLRLGGIEQTMERWRDQRGMPAVEALMPSAPCC
jgi:hypothetical protein